MKNKRKLTEIPNRKKGRKKEEERKEKRYQTGKRNQRIKEKLWKY